MKAPTTPAKAPVIRLVAPTAAVATGLASPFAWGVPGDLDPSFGDVGRVSRLPDLEGPAWSVESGEDGGALLVGSMEYCDYYDYYWGACDKTGFAARLDAGGRLDPSFAAGRLADADVRDVVVQPDGKVVAAGRVLRFGRYRSIVFRLNRDSSPDATFGDDGIVTLEPASDEDERATSLLLEPDGRLVVAGLRGSELLVARFLADGTPDSAFGSRGQFLGPTVNVLASVPRIVRVASGGYRLTVHPASSGDGGSSSAICRVLGVTATGEVDASFGVHGMSGSLPGGSPAGEPGDRAWSDCSSLAAAPQDAILVAGSAGGEEEAGFLTRLRADGSVDEGFSATGAVTVLRRVTALGVGGDAKLTLAGYEQSGLSGAVVMRLQADGTLDTMFGRQGTTVLDLSSELDAWPAVHDLTVLPDGTTILAGGEYGTSPSRPFAARLLGNGGGDSPGILDVADSSPVVSEQDGEAVVTVRRIGGSAGAVSVAFSSGDDSDGDTASAGVDFAPVQGVLTWDDGDASERRIVVPILVDEAAFEFEERLSVTLADAGGGAGLGSRTGTVVILGDSYPHGYFSIEADGVGDEISQRAYVTVRRNDYGSGAVSVTLTAFDGTAVNGKDFIFTAPVTLSWEDGDVGPKSLAITVRDDQRDETNETFTVHLSDATGGARIGPDDTATVRIVDNDSGSGGGRFGFPGALLFAALGWLRRRRAAA